MKIGEVLALGLVLLHGPQKHDLYVNPSAVTTMRAAVPGEKNKHITDAAECVLNTSDGKFISVVETCETVRELFEKAKTR